MVTNGEVGPVKLVIFAVVVAVSAGACAQTAARSTPQQSPAPPAAQTQKPAAPEAPAAAATAKPAAPKALIAKSSDGTSIAYEVAGTGPALVLLHGNGQTRAAWQTQGYSDRLRKQFTVIAVDLRGSGDSGRPMTPDAYAIDRLVADVLAVADAAGAKRFHIWGHGHGATIARYLAARAPERVSAAVLVSATMGPAVTGVFKTAVTALRDKWRPFIDAQAAGTLDVKTMTPSDKTAWDSGIAVSALSLGALLDFPPVEPSDIKVPTLWIVGADDIEGVENVKQYEGKLKGTPVVVKTLSSVSYSDSFIKIEPVMAEVEPFLAKAAAAQTSRDE